MMRILGVAGTCGLGDDPTGWLSGLEAGGAIRALGRPRPPRRVSRDLWRRMGPVDQHAVVAAFDALGGRSGPTVGVVWGNGVGAVAASRVFLRGLDARGPDHARPVAFQTSVHNATAGFLAMAANLTGPSESVFAGGMTGLRALSCARRMLLRPEVEAVLVVVADVAVPDIQRGHAVAEIDPAGDAVCALMVDAAPGAGPRLGFVPPPGRPDLSRRCAVPGEAPRPFTARLAHDDALGLCLGAGLWSVGALAAGGGGTALDWWDDQTLAVEVRP